MDILCGKTLFENVGFETNSRQDGWIANQFHNPAFPPNHPAIYRSIPEPGFFRANPNPDHFLYYLDRHKGTGPKPTQTTA